MKPLLDKGADVNAQGGEPGDSFDGLDAPLAIAKEDLEAVMTPIAHNESVEEMKVRVLLNAEIGEDADEMGEVISDEELDAPEHEAAEETPLTSKEDSSFLTVRDEDYFDSACQQLCQHVQQWVLRFSKFSDTKACRLSSDISDEKIETRLDNTILDGSDVDLLLVDRVKRRNIFMSVVMTIIWEYVFTRYLFGMDREQRQKLKVLEKTLSEVGMYIYK